MHNEIWRSKQFKQIFHTVLLVTFGLLTIALLTMYLLMHHLTLSYLDSVMSRFVETAYSSIEDQILTSQKNALQASSSYDGISLFSANPSSLSDQLKSVRSIDYFVSQDSSIHSVLFYNHATDKIYMFGKEVCTSDLDAFYDQQAVEYIRQKESLADNTPRIIHDSPYTTTSSMVLTSMYSPGYENIVLVNLDVSDIFSVLHNDPAVYSKAPTSYLVFYNKQQVIFDGRYHTEASASDTSLLKTLEAGNWAKSFDGEFNGTWYHFNILQDANNNFQIVSFVQKSDVTATFLSFLSVLLLMSVLMGILATLVNFLVSRKLYSPIAVIKDALSESEHFNDELQKNHDVILTASDEIAFIAHQITAHSHQLDDLSIYKRRSLTISQDTLLKDQLLYNKYPDDQFWDLCAREELPYQPGDHFILVYTKWLPLGPTEEQTPENQSLLCYALDNVMHELFDPLASVRSLPLEKGDVIFLFCHSSGSDPHISREILEQIQQTFANYFRISVSFFLSRSIHSPATLCLTQQQLKELSEYRFFYQNACILQVGELDLDSLNSEICPVADMNSLENAVRASDMEAVGNILDEYFQRLPQYTKESASASLNVFASKCITLLKKIESTSALFPPINYHQFYSSLTTSATITHARNLSYEQFAKVSETLHSAETNSSGIDIKSVQEYIERCYQDFSFSSKSVADHFHMSVTYLNRLFKQRTGDSIAVYTKKLRLEKARDLLLHSSCNIETVARMVGFENTKYFYSLFKSEYGVSPNNYRLSVRESDSRNPSNPS